MRNERFDAITRILAASQSRRSAIKMMGGTGLAAAGISAAPQIMRAQEASPVASPAVSDVQAALDALDPDTYDAIARAHWQTELREADIDPAILAKILDPKNSNEAFGIRAAARLLELIAQPLSFVQSFAPRYETMLPYCTSLSPHQAYIMSNLIGIESSVGFPPLPAAADFQFPQRNAIDLQSTTGWYFFVGSAKGDDGKEYGIELMFFRYSVLPPALATTFGLTDTENQVVELHLSVARAGERHLQAKPIVIAGTTGLLSFETEGLGATMGKNVIRSLDAENVFPIQLQAWGQDDGEVKPVQFSIDITLSSGKGYLLQGADGCSPCCDGVGTLYYSMPNMVMDGAASSLTFDGETINLTEGTFWFDHQWGEISALANSEVARASNNLTPAGPGGWDWFMTHFNGDRQITAFAVHTNDYRPYYHQTGPTPPDTMTVTVHAKYMDAETATHDVEGTLSVTDWILSVDTPSPSNFPPTYTWYPNRWEFSFGADVPADIRDFVMVPIVPTGQSGFFANGAQYSEGAVFLLDPAGNDLGRGFAESVGFADTLPNQLRLTGIPASDDMLALFGKHEPDPGLVLASEAFVYLNQAELAEIASMCIGL